MTSQLEDGVDSQSTITEKELRNLIKEANEILNLFETNHQTDLATHLYSTFLLKNLLRRSNRKKYPQEIDAYIKSNIKDSWTSWPNKKNIIDPMTDSVYQDHLLVERPFKNAFLKPNIQDIKSTNSSSDEQLPMKHVSVEALEHGKDMLALELNSWWQKLILKNSSKHITSPDINLLNIPDDINSRIFDKLDKLFENLNNNFVISRKKNSYENPVRQYLDKLNTLDVIQNNTLKKIENDYLRKSSLGKSLSYANNAPMNITFQDIINMGCQMNEDMTNIYKKSLKLYQDLPIEFKKKPFKLSKTVLKKYKIKKSKKNRDTKIVDNEVYLKISNELNLKKEIAVFFNVKTHNNNHEESHYDDLLGMTKDDFTVQ